jgi:hypothetical protein
MVTVNFNFFYLQNHLDYNGWKNVYCKKIFYFFKMNSIVV